MLMEQLVEAKLNNIKKKWNAAIANYATEVHKTTLAHHWNMNKALKKGPQISAPQIILYYMIVI